MEPSFSSATGLQNGGTVNPYHFALVMDELVENIADGVP